MKKENVKVGMTVYKEEPWSQSIFSAVVTEITDNGVRLDGKYFVKRDGSNVGSDRFYGSTGGRFEEIHKTAEEAYAAQEMKSEKQVHKYCSDMTTPEEVLKFPLQHAFSGEEYTDYDAVKAYRIRCEEIFGVHI